MSVSVSVGLGKSLPQRSVLVPSMLVGGNTPGAPGASGSSGAVKWAQGFTPAPTSIPSPCFPLPTLGKAALRGRAPTLPQPLCAGVSPGPARWDAVAAARSPGLPGEGAVPGTWPSLLLSLFFCTKMLRSPSACQDLSPAALLPCPAA